MNRYNVLGLRADANQEQIKKAYRVLAAKTHPDIGGAVMTPLFLSVQDAYEVLSDPVRRAAYDRELSSGGGPEQQPPPAASNKPKPDSTHQPQASPQSQSEPPAAAAQASPPEQDLQRRRIKRWLFGAMFAILAGYWMFQLFQLGQIVQEDNGLRMFSPQGTPAVACAILWAIGTGIATMAEDWFDAVKAPLICAGLAGGFAYITATGPLAAWITVLGTGLVMTLVIASTIRLRHK